MNQISPESKCTSDEPNCIAASMLIQSELYNCFIESFWCSIKYMNDELNHISAPFKGINADSNCNPSDINNWMLLIESLWDWIVYLLNEIVFMLVKTVSLLNQIVFQLNQSVSVVNQIVPLLNQTVWVINQIVSLLNRLVSVLNQIV